MVFVNTLPYVSNPIEEFSDFKFVSWEKDIYPRFKGEFKKEEQIFFIDLITKHGFKSIIDFGVGGGNELNSIIKGLKEKNYPLMSIEANEVDNEFIKRASNLFKKEKEEVIIHKANWLDLPKAEPPYTHIFDFGFLTGNSLTYIGGGTREYTKKAQQIVVNKFSQLLKKGGYLFIDHRNYDYIKSLMNLPKEKIFEAFTFGYSIYYHGFPNKILVFPAYISDTVIVLHYYDIKDKKWSKLDLYPIYQKDMEEILSQDFTIEKVYYDFGKGTKEKVFLFNIYVKRSNSPKIY